MILAEAKMRLSGLSRAALIGLCGVAVGLLFGASSALAWSLAEAAKPYAGEKIHCAGDGYAPYVAYQELSKEFTEITGIEVEFEVAEFAVLQQKMIADVLNNTGVFDCAEVESVNVGMWVAQGFALPLYEFL